MSPIERVGLVGIGVMGTPMATRLIGAGDDVAGFDPVPSARQRLADAGGTPVETPDDLLDRDLIILMLPNSTVVQSVLVDAPVSGGVRGAVKRTLSVMVGGSDVEFEALCDVLGSFGPVAQVGAGHALTALNNMLSAATTLDDMRIATSLARDLGVPFRSNEQVADLWQEAIDELGGGIDHAEIARWVEIHRAPTGQERTA
jgi:3-hydroxyisobutyrate dehydrogenase-like beta-hydroxyacid dehydrogenase